MMDAEKSLQMAVFKELNGRDFCNSRKVSRAWNNLISNETALQEAYKKRIQERIQTLTEEIENDGYSRQMKQTPFHLAAERGYLPMCKQIMEYIDDKNPKDGAGSTPLHRAAENGHLSVCQLIVENVDDKNPKDMWGETPLDLAVSNNHLGIKKLFEDA